METSACQGRIPRPSSGDPFSGPSTDTHRYIANYPPTCGTLLHAALRPGILCHMPTAVYLLRPAQSGYIL